MNKNMKEIYTVLRLSMHAQELKVSLNLENIKQCSSLFNDNPSCQTYSGNCKIPAEPTEKLEELASVASLGGETGKSRVSKHNIRVGILPRPVA